MVILNVVTPQHAGYKVRDACFFFSDDVIGTGLRQFLFAVHEARADENRQFRPPGADRARSEERRVGKECRL